MAALQPDALKIEPLQGDHTHVWGPRCEDAVASCYLGLNRNRRLMRLDLATEADRGVLLSLLAEADVVVENFKTGTLEKWGIGRDVLSQRFPRLVH